MQSLREIELRAPAERAKIGVFVCQAWSACAWGTQFKQVLCDGLMVDFDAVFNTFSECIALSDALHTSHFLR